jgi:hypothetical protein
LEDYRNRIAIITLDLLAIDVEEADEIRRRVAHIGFKPENVMIAASHTHSGPPSIKLGSVRKSEELTVEATDKASQCVRESVQRLTQASLRAGFTEFQDNVNRRQPIWLMRRKLGVNLKGPVDHQLSYLQIKTERETILVVCYGCHPIMTRNIPCASADFVAGLRRFASSAQISNVLFLNGALGDVNPYDRVRRSPLDLAGIEAALNFGGRMASAALNSSLVQSDDPDPRVSSTSEKLQLYLPRLEGGELRRTILVQAFRIGQLAMIGFPGEIFAQTGLDLKKKSGNPNLAVVSCANGYVGYVPPRHEYIRGGYEVVTAPRLFGYRVPKGVCEEFQGLAERLLAR